MQSDISGADFRIWLINRTKIHSAFIQVSLVELLLSQPTNGLDDSPRGQGFVLFLWRIPHLIPTDPAWRASVYFAHQLGVCVLAVLVAGHAAAALVHRFILRNEAPQGTPPSRAAATFGSATEAR